MNRKLPFLSIFFFFGIWLVGMFAPRAAALIMHNFAEKLDPSLLEKKHQ